MREPATNPLLPLWEKPERPVRWLGMRGQRGALITPLLRQCMKPHQKAFARHLRKNMTPSEKLLWHALRGRRLDSFKFRRQQSIGRYIVDFYCAEIALIIELDGESHLGKETYDENRKAELEALGHQVLKIWDTEVFGNLDGVLEFIYQQCQSRCK